MDGKLISDNCGSWLNIWDVYPIKIWNICFVFCLLYDCKCETFGVIFLTFSELNSSRINKKMRNKMKMLVSALISCLCVCMLGWGWGGTFWTLGLCCATETWFISKIQQFCWLEWRNRSSTVKKPETINIQGSDPSSSEGHVTKIYQ